MDLRSPLTPNTVLPFEGISCHVQELIGCGSNAMVYRGWYPDRMHPELRHHVLIKELFPNHPKGAIHRCVTGQIVVDPGAEDVFSIHKESFLQGNAIHLRLLEDHPGLLGGNLNTFSHQGTLYTVLDYNGGRSLGEALIHSGGNLIDIVNRMILILDGLEAFHKSGYLHLDISPDNIMLLSQGKRESVFLIDYNSARPISSRDYGFLSRKAGYSPPEVENGDVNQIGIPSDLYSVAAVFYRMLMGRTLTLEETLRPKAPDGQESTLLKDTPQTARSMVASILRKGLHTLPRKRFQSISQMRSAFTELLDRIHSVGITHWALWESGKRSLEERIRNNPALSYVTTEEDLYPIRLEGENRHWTLSGFLPWYTGNQGYSAQLLGEGGLGKSTMLMRTALTLSRHYAPSAPAVFYLPLGGWQGNRTDEIKSRILMTLRFKQGENTWMDAMQRLGKLLNEPLKTKNGSVPGVILLLDGLNEVLGDSAPLLEEIQGLAQCSGVRILVVSRRGETALNLPPLKLCPLEREDVTIALGRAGLLVPRDEKITALLHTPLVLSLYLQTGSVGEQPEVTDREHLVDAYLDSLYRKASDGLPQENPLPWQMDAALRYLLPCVAAEERRRGRALTRLELVRLSEQCWKFLHSRRFRKHFPQWIGRTGEICAGSESPEAWYAREMEDLLWRKFGLLIRETNGDFRVYHQVIRDALAEKPCTRIAGQERTIRLTAVACCMALCAAFALTMPGWNHYETKTAQLAIDYASCGYAACGTLYQRLRTLVDLAQAGENDAFFHYYERYLGEIQQEAQWSETETLYLAHISREILSRPEKIVSWSGEPMDGELATELLNCATERAAYYAETLPLLAKWMSSAQARQDCPDFADVFSGVVEADADVMSELYHRVCAPHLTGGEAQWQENVRELIRGVSALEEHRVLDVMEDREQYLKQLRQGLTDEESMLSRLAVVVQYSVED